MFYPLNYYKRKTKKLAISLPVSLLSSKILWASPGLERVKHSRKKRAITVGHLYDEPGDKAEHKENRQEHYDDY